MSQLQPYSIAGSPFCLPVARPPPTGPQANSSQQPQDPRRDPRTRHAAGSLLRHGGAGPPGRPLSPPPPPGAGVVFRKLREGGGCLPLVPGQPESASIRPSRAHADPSKLAMPENIVTRSGPPAGAAGGRGKSAYQDRDKPAQIRFSNISAAKGIAARRKPWPSGLSCAFSLPVLDGHDSFSVPSDDPLWASHRISSVQGSSCLFSAHDFRPRVWRPLDLPYSAS